MDVREQEVRERIFGSERVVVLLLLLAVVVVYWRVTDCEFIGFDDGQYVVENPHVHAGLSAQSVTWAFTTTAASNWVPLTWLSYMLDYELYGLEAGRHHLTSLLLHLLSALVLLALLRQLTGSLWPSAFVAMVFAVHPLRVESVAWVGERKDVLCTLLWMLSLQAYIGYTKNPGLPRYLLLTLLFLLGLMAKPMLVTLPFVLLLSRDFKRDARRLAVVAIVLLAMRWLDLYWQAAPTFQHGEEHRGLAFHWLDLATVVGVGGIWLGFYFGELKKRPLLPVFEPYLGQALDNQHD